MSSATTNSTHGTATASMVGGSNSSNGTVGGITKMGYAVLILLAVQNCSKNLLMRYVLKDRPEFLTSAAVLGCEFTKLSMSVMYIVFVEKKPFYSILQYLRLDMKNTLLLY
jgi:hypothetical protein